MRLFSTAKIQTQQGYLVMLAVMFILIIGFLGVVIASITGLSANSVNNFIQGENALLIAEAGFEETAHLLLNPTLSGTNARIACSSVSGNSNLTNTGFGSGTFTATTVAGNPVYKNTTLSSAIGSNDTTIPVASTAGFASAGRIMIDQEIINYGGISGNSFIGVQRGANNNYNTSHASGAAVSQFQCTVKVSGGIPNLISPTYKRQIMQAVPLQEAWAVGNVSSTNFVLTHWNQPTELAWNANLISNVSATTLNSISMLSNAEGWAVGNAFLTNLVFLHWTGSNWTILNSMSASCTSQNLLGVSTVSSQEAWAVGNTCGSFSKSYSILKWNGSTWTILTPSSTPSIPAASFSNQNLNSVHVIAAAGNSTGNIGFAVGNSGQILKYNGTAWTKDTSPTSNNLLSVYVVSASEAWAVGASGTILKWNGSTWSIVTSPTSAQLNSIYMLDATLSGTAQSGWAVGNGGVAIKYNGSSWSTSTTGTSSNLLGVAMFINPTQDVWAVGAGGLILHYDGNAWSSVASNVSTQLNAIALIAPQQYPYAWQEIYA